jgi:hypothetical protein
MAVTESEISGASCHIQLCGPRFRGSLRVADHDRQVTTMSAWNPANSIPCQSNKHHPHYNSITQGAL